ncbi:MAG: site-specific integrase [Solirubrobacterales bacterium]|nr:site-specific integrase [Solirubrobacterales bacterium]
MAHAEEHGRTYDRRPTEKADIVRVKEWMGHADVQTTMRYLHYSPKPDDAQLVAEAFAAEPVLAAAA